MTSRTLPDQGDPSNVLLASLLRDVKARQALVREIVEDDEDAVEVRVGWGRCRHEQL